MAEKIRILLGLESFSVEDNKVIQTLIDLAAARLALLAGVSADDIPKELEHVLIQVVIRAFNRIGSEGLKSHSVGGETMAFSADDFADFMDDIAAYKAMAGNTGKVRFL